MQRSLSIFFLFVSIFCLADDDILVEATLNGRPATLIFDTGAEATVLWTAAARRRGIKTVRAPAVGGLARGGDRTRLTQTCALTVGPVKTSDSFEVISTLAPIARRTDGVLGWKTIRNQLLHVHADKGTLTFLSQLPNDVGEWQKWDVCGDLDMLVLKLQGRRKRHQGVVFVDTGAHHGVCLATDLWERWRGKLIGHGHTLHALFNPHAGAAVREVLWAPQLELGPLSFRNVTVRQCYRFDEAFFERRKGHTYRATIGRQALRGKELVIDGRSGIAYTRPGNSGVPTSVPPHNRTGAVFVPASRHSYSLEAHVLDGSPAHEAGVRKGDVLLAIGDIPVAQWRSNPDRPPLSSFWNQPNGTELELTVRRRGRDVKAHILLRDLLVPHP